MLLLFFIWNSIFSKEIYESYNKNLLVNLKNFGFNEKIINILTDNDKNIVLLCVVGGLKSGEVAKIMGLTAVNVRQRLHRSLHKMRNYLS